MRILITNDDGYDADGLVAMTAALKGAHSVAIAAPAAQQSGMARAITVHSDVEVERTVTVGDVPTWVVHGTPADCVKIYLEAIAVDEPRPDLVISGINRGANLGSDVLYSGTVGAAIEGFFHGVSSWAVSLDVKSAIPVARVAQLVVEHMPRLLADEPRLLNLNFPRAFADDPPRFAYASVGHRDYSDPFRRIERDGRLFFRMGGQPCDGVNPEGSDLVQTARGHVAVTPLQLDLTDHELLRRLRGDT